jgi:hypothetical protein
LKYGNETIQLLAKAEAFWTSHSHAGVVAVDTITTPSPPIALTDESKVEADDLILASFFMRFLDEPGATEREEQEGGGEAFGCQSEVTVAIDSNLNAKESVSTPTPEAEKTGLSLSTSPSHPCPSAPSWSDLAAEAKSSFLKEWAELVATYSDAGARPSFGQDGAKVQVLGRPHTQTAEIAVTSAGVCFDDDDSLVYSDWNEEDSSDSLAYSITSISYVSTPSPSSSSSSSSFVSPSSNLLFEEKMLAAFWNRLLDETVVAEDEVRGGEGGEPLGFQTDAALDFDSNFDYGGEERWMSVVQAEEKIALLSPPFAAKKPQRTHRSKGGAKQGRSKSIAAVRGPLRRSKRIAAVQGPLRRSERIAKRPPVSYKGMC